MGFFDTIHCEYPLPDQRHQDREFQTTDLEPLMYAYTITRDGRLVLRESDGEIELPIHGDVRIHASTKAPEDSEWAEYVVRFTNDHVEWIRPSAEVPRKPELPPPDWLQGEPAALEEILGKQETERASLQPTEPSPEEALLLNLRRDRQDLQSLLERCSDHWGYEDPVYRFYHQSFKVFGLQDQTRSIVERLQALAPDLPLNPWFVQIIESGTGKAFKLEDNEQWPEVTRPILEAFFHTRFFLEMAVRYADLQAPPRPLPSGYAALLYLFCIR